MSDAEGGHVDDLQFRRRLRLRMTSGRQFKPTGTECNALFFLSHGQRVAVGFGGRSRIAFGGLGVLPLTSTAQGINVLAVTSIG